MKIRLMIVRGESSTPQEFDLHTLYRFLKLTAGNYRNSVYVRCKDGIEFMLVTDEEAKPLLFPINLFYELTGEYPQRDEMSYELTHDAFETLYRSWILWNTDKEECPICSLQVSEVSKKTNEEKAENILSVLRSGSQAPPGKCCIQGEHDR